MTPHFSRVSGRVRGKGAWMMKRAIERVNVMKGTALIALLCLLVAGCFAGTGDAADIKIVSIDTQKVFSEHPAFQEAMGKFQAQIQEMQKKIEEMKEEDRGPAQQMFQQQMQQLGMQLQEEAFNKMKADVQKFAKKKGYTYVVDSNMLIVGGKDVTEEVRASFPKPEPKKEETAPPAPEKGESTAPPVQEKEASPTPPAVEKK